jgi:hypothetical protein
MDLLGIALVVGAICGGISYNLAWKKNRSGLEGFCWGFCLGVIGLVVVALLPAGEPRAPVGMQAFACPRCNANQNIPSSVPTFECWQCKLVITNPSYTQGQPPISA